MALNPVSAVAPDDIGLLLTSFLRHLRAENLSPKTVDTYAESTRQLAAYLRVQGMPTTLSHIRREHVES